MRVYLDDERKAPEGWHQVRWPDEAIALLKQGRVVEISLDHDLGDDERGTGYDVVLWIEEAVATGDFCPPKMSVHSANTSARTKMEAGIAAIQRMVVHNSHYKNTWGTPVGQDCINLDLALIRWLGERLEFLSRHTNTHPCVYRDLIDWRSDCLKYGEVLLRYAQEDYSSGNVMEQEAREAMRWVAEHFGRFWD